MRQREMSVETCTLSDGPAHPSRLVEPLSELRLIECPICVLCLAGGEVVAGKVVRALSDVWGALPAGAKGCLARLWNDERPSVQLQDEGIPRALADVKADRGTIRIWTAFAEQAPLDVVQCVLAHELGHAMLAGAVLHLGLADGAAMSSGDDNPCQNSALEALVDEVARSWGFGREPLDRWLDEIIASVRGDELGLHPDGVNHATLGIGP